MSSRRWRRMLCAALAAAAGARAQQEPLQETPSPAAPQDQAPPAAQGPGFDFNFLQSDPQRGDFGELYLFGGFRFLWPAAGIEIRGRNALQRTDRDATDRLLAADRGDSLPRRGIDLPEPRRRLTREVLLQRVNRLLGALGRPPVSQAADLELLDVPRFLYFEGDVLVFRDGVEVARCERLWISPLDDRIVVEGAELRYLTAAGPGRNAETLIVRGPRIVKQGGRWTGRDLQVTTCEAGKPHVSVASGELDILEREGQFEIRSRGNTLQLSGFNLLPLPDAHVFTGEQSDIPLKGASAGYSNREGVQTRVELGQSFNQTGGALHEFFTGRPAQEFRGDWQLGLGWIEKRGFPVDGQFDYRARNSDGDLLYEGLLQGYYMDDDGPNLLEIVDNLDGSPILDRNRHLARTRNRVHLGEATHLDLTAFYAGDAAVYSEFFRNDYRNEKVPETSVYLHHRSDNVLVTAGGRFNLSDFSYRDNRALAPFFVEELPVATLDWVAQPIATTPWDTPIVLDARTEVGQRQRDYDDTFSGLRAEDRTLRFDQLVELSAPLLLGPLNVRPFVQTRWTWYDAGTDGESADRAAFTAGVRAGTRLSRTFSWTDPNGSSTSLRHVISPMISVLDRFHVDGDPGEFRQYDDIDALTEQTLVRLELRNLVQRTDSAAPAGADAADEDPPADAQSAPRDFVFLDFAQDIWPDADRDNAGDQLGLFYYDFLVRPGNGLTSLSNLSFGVYGDHDWQDGLRTFDTEVGFGRVLGFDWFADYRRDAVVDGAVGVGASTSLLGRWSSYANVVYDMDRSDWLSYGFGMRRDDHDWSLLLAVSYDPFDDQVSLRMTFEPSFGGRPPLRSREWTGDQFDTSRNASYY